MISYPKTGLIRSFSFLILLATANSSQAKTQMTINSPVCKTGKDTSYIVITINKIAISHRVVTVKQDFEVFTGNLEKLLGRITKEDFDLVKSDPLNAEKHLSSLGGYQDLILFGIQDHGSLLNLKGKPRKARQYSIGNPLTALKMTNIDIRAALYAPLRILVYETKSKTVHVEYDLPSSLFGQLKNPGVTEVAKQLDDKLIKLIYHADEK